MTQKVLEFSRNFQKVPQFPTVLENSRSFRNLPGTKVIWPGKTGLLLPNNKNWLIAENFEKTASVTTNSRN